MNFCQVPRCPHHLFLEKSMKKFKFSILDLIKVAISNNGYCLSESYYGVKFKYRWRCEYGHEWDAKFEKIKVGQWCPECAKKRNAENRYKYTIEDLQNIASAKGGQCLSNEFRGLGAKYKWQCDSGHSWTANASNLISLRRWCPECGRQKSDLSRRRYTIEDLKIFAKKKGGECLSSEYHGVVAKYTWRCSLEHVWDASFHKIKNGDNWCPVCARVEGGV